MFEITFGALTAAGAGRIPLNGTIKSGDPLGHWQVKDGYLTPSPAGDAADLGAGPYRLSLSSGETRTITIIADAYTVASDAEADALPWDAIAAAPKSRTVLFRGPANGGPAFYTYVRPSASKAYYSAPWFNLRNFAAEVVCRSADAADRAIIHTTSTSGGVRYRSFLVQTGNVALVDLHLYAPWVEATPQYNMSGTIANYSYKSGEEQQGVGALDLRNSIGNLRIEGCELSANLRDYPATPRKLMWYGLIGDDGSAKFTGTFVFKNNVVHGARRLLELPAGGKVTLEGNEFYDYGGDCVVFSGVNNDMTICWNYLHSPYNEIGDIGHADFFQWVYAGTSNITGVSIYGNILNAYRHDGAPAKNDTQGFFADDIGQPAAPAYYEGWKIYNNLIITESGHGITLKPGKDCFVWRNTLVKNIAANSYNGDPTIMELHNGTVGSQPSNNTFVANIATLVSLRPDSGSTKFVNLELQRDLAGLYRANFQGADYLPTSKSDALAKFAPRAGSEAALARLGAIGDYINFAARTVDTAFAPWVAATVPESFALTNRTATEGALVESDTVIVSGLTGPTFVEIEGGEYQINGGPWHSAATWTALPDSKVIAGLASKASYAVQVRGASGTRRGPASSTVTLTTS